MAIEVIDNWKTRSDGVVLHITNPDIAADGAYGERRLRCDQTGHIYLNAHDVQDSPYTYTEVVKMIDPTDVPRFVYGQEYSKGDRVVESGKIWESYIDNNVNMTPSTQIWGWDEVWPMPYFEEKEPIWIAVQEAATEDGDGE